MPFAITRFGIQVAALIAGAGVLVTSCVVRDRSVEQRGAAKVVSASKKAGPRPMLQIVKCAAGLLSLAL